MVVDIALFEELSITQNLFAWEEKNIEQPCLIPNILSSLKDSYLESMGP